MKATTKLTMIIGLILMSLSIGAQSNIGFHAGVTYSDMSSASLAFDLFDDVLPQSKRMVGTKFGVFAEFPMNQNVAFLTGLDYTDKGFAVRESINLNVFELPIPIGATVNARLKYLEVPLAMKYSFNNNSPIRPYIKAGGTLGYASSAELQTRARVFLPINVLDIPVGLNTGLINRFEVGGLIGAGVEMPVGQGAINVDLQYTHGFSSLIETPIVDLRAKNNAFGLSVGYKIPIGGKAFGA